MKAIVVHHNLNILGGAERLAVNVIELLNEMGYEVHLVTTKKPDIDALKDSFGKKLNIVKVHCLLPFQFNYFSIYQKLFTNLYVFLIRDVDVIINTTGDVRNYFAKKKVPNFLYMHFPQSPLSVKEYPSKYGASFFWKFYLLPYRFAVKVLMNRTIENTTILTNSNYSKNAIKKVFPEIQPIILHPPVDIQNFSKDIESKTRNQTIVVTARFHPEKNLETAIKIAKILPRNINLMMIGNLTSINQSYFNRLREILRKEEMEDRVRLLPNLSFEELINSIATSSVYLHTMKGEHFGISIVEAMAGGLIPIVPNEGGQTEFVPPDYHYATIEEAAEKIMRVMSAKKSERVRMNTIASQFSEVSFKRALRKIIEQKR